MQAPSIYDPFWSLSLGNVLTIVIVVLTLWGFHRSNVKRINENAEKAIRVAAESASEMAQIKTKVDLLYSWFMRHVAGKFD